MRHYFDVFPGFCGPPPVIENAEVQHVVNSPLGGKVFYTCQEGYIRLSGDSYLTCTTSDDSEHLWTGVNIECIQYSEDSKWNY